MRREFLPLALLVLFAFEGKALAEEPLLLETEPEASAATSVTGVAQKPELPSRVGPILLIVGGGVTTFMAGGILLLACARGRTAAPPMSPDLRWPVPWASRR